MIYSMTMKVSGEELFDVLMTSLKYDIEISAKNALKAKNVDTVEVSADVENEEVVDIFESEKNDSTDEKAGKAEIEVGFTYSKTLSNALGRDVKTIFEIYKLEKNKEYTVKVRTGESVHFVKYEMNETENGLEVTYSETSEYVKKYKKLNESLVSVFKKKGNVKKIKNLLESIEKFIISKRTSL